ncbi:GNAT family N-acetyltransferase [Microbispora sp. H11081]|uniref:GNAT family N-acetyltransferase n=1 Tax=Microbispora sp. H11081 TaxID=2729107 RepID=UPI001473327A|nr:GNAT family N-acetyltransferase [Microbispora sp. H11081]
MLDPLSTPAAELPVRRLGPEDLDRCLALSQDRSWAREERKWLFLLENTEVHAIDAPSGELAATVTLTRYGTAAAGVGMMLVATRYGGRGLGRRLMTHVLGTAGDATVFLWATELGRPLYEKLGFETLGVTEARVGRLRPGDAPVLSRPADLDADLGALLALDRQAFGADRAALLGRLFAMAEEVRVTEDETGPTGYAVSWLSGSTLFIGPVVADDEAGARALVTDLTRHASGLVRIEMDRSRPGLLAWLGERGAAQAFSTSFMVHGGRPLPGDRTRVFAPMMLAMG